MDIYREHLYITAGVIFCGLVLASFFVGTIILNPQMLLIAFIGGGFLYGFQVLLLKIRCNKQKVALKLLAVIVGLLALIAGLNLMIEYLTESVFMLRKTHPGILLFIYGSGLLIFAFMLVHRFVKERIWYIALQSVVVLLVVLVGIYDVLLVFLGGATLTEVEFGQASDRQIYLVESSFIFSSTHTLYEKEMTYYGRIVEHDGSWTCHDGCITGSPEAYSWHWVDDDTLEVMYDAWDQPLVYYFD